VATRTLLAFALAALLGSAAGAQPTPDLEAERAFARAQRDWGHAIGTLGYVYGAPLLELAIAEYRQTQGIAPDIRSLRGLFGHLMGGRLPSHETTWLAVPDPTRLYSSAWLDVRAQPSVLWIPPMEGHSYGIRFADAFGNDVAYLSSRTIGSVGGWFLVAHESWQGERPAGLMLQEVRVPTPTTWVLVSIAATAKNAPDFHARYQAPLKFVPLDVYARSPESAAVAKPPVQPGTPIRAMAEMRGTLDAFRVINDHLRQLEPAPGEAALLGLFDQAGFGPSVAFDPAKLPAPLVEGLRSAARDAQRTLDDFRSQPRDAENGWSRRPARTGASGPDYLQRALAAADGLGASVSDEVLALHALRDRDGRPLDGRNDYVIHFDSAALPPAKAGWSIAAYGADSLRLLDTRTGRYAVGSDSEGLVTLPNGDVEVFLSVDAPEDPKQRANWLPVRPGPFVLIARLYEPLRAALDGSYVPPPIVPADD
jgi:hypothetical protein